ncbi:MAG TPA: DinB family protein [Candidatus Angelobacter sp.]|jgi:uncharacterized damage-inducible protein DinB|nr:DinB family protein [Candidatus Angelobacter sp.]
MIKDLERNWNANCSMNLALLKEIPEEALNLSAGKGARTVRDILMHMPKVRNQWLKAIAADLVKSQEKAAKAANKAGSSEKDILAAHKETAVAVKTLILRTGDPTAKIKAFKPDLLAFIFYIVAHDAHHRGQVLLTLRVCGHRASQDLSYGIWDWGKHMQKDIYGNNV